MTWIFTASANTVDPLYDTPGFVSTTGWAIRDGVQESLVKGGYSFSDDVLGLCMECLLRGEGKHYHGVMGWALKREAHQGWFRADTLDLMRQGQAPRVDMVGCIDYADNWSYEFRNMREYLKLTIDPSEIEPEARTFVWRLRYDQKPRVFHGISTIQGTWPD